MADETNPFQPGDVVQLKSGGALVTVGYLEKEKITFFYADKDGVPTRHSTPMLAVLFKKVDLPAEPYAGEFPISVGA